MAHVVMPMNAPIEPLAPPATSPLPHDIKRYTTKFSDLNSYFQGLQTRLGVTVGLVGITITAAGLAGRLLPSPPPGALWPLAFAAGACFVSVLILAGSALAVSRPLSLLVERRLGARDLENPDAVDGRLQEAMVKEIKRRHVVLRQSHAFLAVGVMSLLAHALLVVGVDAHASALRLAPNSCGALGSTYEACAFNVSNLALLAALLGVSALFSWLDWLRERRAQRTVAPHSPEQS